MLPFWLLRVLLALTPWLQLLHSFGMAPKQKQAAATATAAGRKLAVQDSLASADSAEIPRAVPNEAGAAGAASAASASDAGLTADRTPCALASKLRLYSQDTSIAELFGKDLDGLLLWQAIKDAYQVGPKTTLKFYSEDGGITITTHDMNKRNQRGKEKKFCRGIIKRGLSQSVRGDVVALDFAYNGPLVRPLLGLSRN
jgi:hypothetical protein